MTLVKWQNNDRLPVFSNFFEDFLQDDDLGFFKNTGLKRVPAVNILEGKDNYTIEVAAPGLNKNDFKVQLENNLLTIESAKEDKKDENNERFTRREFSYSKFQRSFTLPMSIDSSKIDAKYEEGILKVNLPKKEEAKVKPSREISIS